MEGGWDAFGAAECVSLLVCAFFRGGGERGSVVYIFPLRNDGRRGRCGRCGVIIALPGSK